MKTQVTSHYCRLISAVSTLKTETAAVYTAESTAESVTSQRVVRDVVDFIYPCSIRSTVFDDDDDCLLFSVTQQPLVSTYSCRRLEYDSMVRTSSGSITSQSLVTDTVPRARPHQCSDATVPIRACIQLS